uniref:Uncharacterized protein n=1 Tax=Oryza punctata TaxID=4537 RepID=A0A0E0JDC8_ORYPU
MGPVIGSVVGLDDPSRPVDLRPSSSSSEVKPIEKRTRRLAAAAANCCALRLSVSLNGGAGYSTASPSGLRPTAASSSASPTPSTPAPETQPTPLRAPANCPAYSASDC